MLVFIELIHQSRIDHVSISICAFWLVSRSSLLLVHAKIPKVAIQRIQMPKIWSYKVPSFAQMTALNVYAQGPVTQKLLQTMLLVTVTEILVARKY